MLAAMAVSLCVCGRHVLSRDACCPFCGATSRTRVPRLTGGRRSRAAIMVGTAALGVACGARTELGVIGRAQETDAAQDAADEDSAFSFPDASGFDVSIPDVHEEIILPPPPYGAPPPPGDGK
jgi:hypothetical protein